MRDKLRKKAYLGSIYMPGKYMLRVCSESPFTRMIPSLKYKCPLLAYITYKWYTVATVVATFLHSPIHNVNSSN